MKSHGMPWLFHAWANPKALAEPASAAALRLAASQAAAGSGCVRVGVLSKK